MSARRDPDLVAADARLVALLGGAARPEAPRPFRAAPQAGPDAGEVDLGAQPDDGGWARPGAGRGSDDAGRRGPAESAPWEEDDLGPVEEDPEEGPAEQEVGLEPRSGSHTAVWRPRGVAAAHRSVGGSSSRPALPPRPPSRRAEEPGGGSVAGRRERPGLLTLPESLRGARHEVSGRALLGVLAVVLVIAAVLGVRVALARSSAEPVPVETVAGSGSGAWPAGVARAPSAAGPTGSPAGSAPGSAAGAPGAGAASGAPAPGGAAPGATPTADATSAGTLVVHVVGEVNRPGVVRLTAGSRLADAVRRAGGLGRRADATSVNLARPVVDGEQIVVLARGARPSSAAPGAPAAPAAPGAAGGSASRPGAPAGAPGASGGPAASAGSPVDLNSADEATLDTLPGIGPVMARRIIEWRTQHGRFGSVEELGEIDGVGDKTLERLRPLVRV